MPALLPSALLCAAPPLLATLAAPASGATPPPADGPTVRIEGRDGSTESVPVPAAGAASERRWLGGASGGIRLDVEGVPQLGGHVRTARFAQLTLAGGDPLLGELKGGHGERVFVELLGETVVEVPIEDLRALRFPTRVEVEGEGPVTAAEEGDRLYWRKGDSLDRLDGVVAEFLPEGVAFESVLGTKTFPWEEVAALFVELLDEPGAEEPVEGTAVVVDLLDGSRLRGGLVGLDASGVRLARPSGELRVPLGAVAELVVDDGSVAYLSALEPAEVDEGSPFGDDLGMVWPHRADRSVSGAPLTAGGRRYARGVGVHAPSRLSWDLDGEWAELRGAVALDDQVQLLPARGSVHFRVLVDGELRWESPLLRGGDPVVELEPVQLAGARRLTLEVDMATDLHLGDRADWLRMMLVR